MTKLLRVGIWAQLPIGSQWQHEGLSRLLGFIIEGSDASKIEFVIVAPQWVRHDVEQDIMTLRNTSGCNVEVVSNAGAIPLILRVLQYFSARARKPHEKSLKTGFFNSISRAEKYLWDATSTFLALPIGVTSTLFAWFLVVLLALPVFVISLPLLVALLLLRIISSPVLLLHQAAQKSALLSSVMRYLSRKIGEQRNRARQYLRAQLGLLIRKTYRYEFGRLAKYANKKLMVDCWLLLNPFTMDPMNLKAPIISLLADFVPAACPSGFGEDQVESAANAMHKLIPRVQKFIALSEHVKTEHGCKIFGIEESKIAVIRHAPIDLSPLLPSYRKGSLRTPHSRSLAASKIRDYCTHELVHHSWTETQLLHDYLVDFPFEEVDYVFVSTQNRPYKNIKRVAEAVELLLRKEHLDIKMIVTCGMDILSTGGDGLGSFVGRNLLQHDIISLPRVPRDVHAALYHCAAVTVHPSFFEGGTGAFPFYESLSLGTPVLLARNPATLEACDGEDYYGLLYDPYSVSELASKIKHILYHREQSFDLQWKIYDRHASRRNWKIVATEYYDVFSEGRSLSGSSNPR